MDAHIASPATFALGSARGIACTLDLEGRKLSFWDMVSYEEGEEGEGEEEDVEME